MGKYLGTVLRCCSRYGNICAPSYIFRGYLPGFLGGLLPIADLKISSAGGAVVDLKPDLGAYMYQKGGYTDHWPKSINIIMWRKRGNSTLSKSPWGLE